MGRGQRLEKAGKNAGRMPKAESMIQTEVIYLSNIPEIPLRTSELSACNCSNHHTKRCDATLARLLVA